MPQIIDLNCILNKNKRSQEATFEQDYSMKKKKKDYINMK